MNPSPKSRLRLLGSPSLAGPDGVPVAGRAGQRHRLALLAFLARSPASGVSRDVLMAHLWPESDLEQARNLLKVSVYVLRQALGDGAVQSVGDALRLSSEVVDVDVWDFEAALARGDFEEAVSLYAGPFLEGLSLKNAPELGHWIDRERARLADGFASALESLAEEAQRRGDPTAAVQWWKARAAHDPYDSRVALALMNALAAAGSRAGALQHAAVHTSLLREHLGIEPAAELRALAERLRSEPEPLDVPVEPPPVFRVTPPSEHESPSLEPAPPSAPRHEARGGRRAWARPLAAAAILALALVIGVRDDEPAVAAPESLVVLPIASRGLDARDAIFADGMTEELIAVLSGAGLRVISSTTAFAFRDHRGDVRQIADSLGVTYVLEGDWQTQGSILLVRLRLVDGRDGAIRWSRDYQRQLSDLFEVRADIARAVVREIGRTSEGATESRGAARGTESVSAWELYRRASQSEVLRSDVTAQQALALMRQAVELDPSFAGAHAGLARLHIRVGPPEDPDAPAVIRLAEARQHALTAVQLDGSLAEAHAALGAVEMWLYDFPAAETHLRRAAELDPSSSRAREALVALHLWMGDFSEALEQAERGLDLDPLSPTARAELARVFVVLGRCEEARLHLAMLAQLDPPLLRAGPLAAQCYAQERRWDDAIAEIERRGDFAGTGGTAGLAYFLARAGREGEASELLDELLRESEGEAFNIAQVYVGLGRVDEAFTWLGRSIDEHSFSREIVEPMFADLHRDVRYAELIGRVGLTPPG